MLSGVFEALLLIEMVSTWLRCKVCLRAEKSYQAAFLVPGRKSWCNLLPKIGRILGKQHLRSKCPCPAVFLNHFFSSNCAHKWLRFKVYLRCVFAPLTCLSFWQQVMVQSEICRKQHLLRLKCHGINSQDVWIKRNYPPKFF